MNCYWATAELLESLEDHWKNDYPDTNGRLAAPTGKAITVLFGREWITEHFEIWCLIPKWMAQSINVLHYCLCVAPFLSVIYSPQPPILCFFNLILYGFYRYKQELFVITVPTVVASKDCRLLGFVLCSWSNSMLLLISCGHVWFAVALTKARYSALSPQITKKHRSLQSPAEGKKKKSIRDCNG